MNFLDVYAFWDTKKGELTLTFVGPKRDSTDNKDVVLNRFLKTTNGDFQSLLVQHEKQDILKNLVEGIK